jgi:hypothetical protein
MRVKNGEERRKRKKDEKREVIERKGEFKENGRKKQ